MLDKLKYPLTNTQITNFILDKDYTDYFTIQQTLSDLLSSELIVAESTHSNTRYHITDYGEWTLRFFHEKISDGIKHDIDRYFEEKQYELIQEASIYADYYKATGQGYQVRCRVENEEHSIIDLTLHTSTKEQAEVICANWEKENEDVYALLMDMLIK